MAGSRAAGCLVLRAQYVVRSPTYTQFEACTESRKNPLAKGGERTAGDGPAMIDPLFDGYLRPPPFASRLVSAQQLTLVQSIAPASAILLPAKNGALAPAGARDPGEADYPCAAHGGASWVTEIRSHLHRGDCADSVWMNHLAVRLVRSLTVTALIGQPDPAAGYTRRISLLLMRGNAPSRCLVSGRPLTPARNVSPRSAVLKLSECHVARGQPYE
jgi:hypothetical protein